MRSLNDVLDRLIRQATAAKSCLDAGLPLIYDAKEISDEWILQLGDFTIIDRRPAPMSIEDIALCFKNNPETGGL